MNKSERDVEPSWYFSLPNIISLAVNHMAISKGSSVTTTTWAVIKSSSFARLTA